MQWFYAESGSIKGPVEEPEFNELLARSVIKEDTLIWTSGMASWQPWAEARSAGNATSEPELPVSEPATELETSGSGVAVEVASPPPAPSDYCSQCGRSFPFDEMIQYEGGYLCATCKPLFFQRLKEGFTASTHAEFGGFWIRFLAKFIDGIICQVVTYAVLIATTMTGLFYAVSRGSAILAGLLAFVPFLFSLLFNAAYTTYFVGKFGATPGKMVCKLQVVTASGRPLGYGLACGRHFAEYISGIILSIGYIMAGFDEEKRALHDHICGTRVIRK
jgi:uncharacterized RDD family membrane protein YckC